jgi:hypothetical protein
MNWFNLNSKKENIQKWLIIVSAIFLIAATLSFFLYYEVEKKYTDKIYPGVYI